MTNANRNLFNKQAIRINSSSVVIVSIKNATSKTNVRFALGMKTINVKKIINFLLFSYSFTVSSLLLSIKNKMTVLKNIKEKDAIGSDKVYFNNI